MSKKDLQKELDKLTKTLKKNKEFDVKDFDIVDLFCYFSSNKLDFSYWKSLYILQLMYWGFSKKSAEHLFEWGSYGHNWEKLHPTEEDSKKTIEEITNRFYGEVAYCSDRMWLDRLFRCHWLYNYKLLRDKDVQVKC